MCGLLLHMFRDLSVGQSVCHPVCVCVCVCVCVSVLDTLVSQ